MHMATKMVNQNGGFVLFSFDFQAGFSRYEILTTVRLFKRCFLKAYFHRALVICQG